jgi:hypothetical protein
MRSLVRPIRSVTLSSVAFARHAEPYLVFSSDFTYARIAEALLKLQPPCRPQAKPLRCARAGDRAPALSIRVTEAEFGDFVKFYHLMTQLQSSHWLKEIHRSMTLRDASNTLAWVLFV